VQSSSINRLETELASLKSIKTSQSKTAVNPDASSLPEVQQELSEQGDLIRTLEQRIATQIIDLDNLRSSIGGTNTGSSATGNSSTGALPSAEVEQIRKNLQSMETRLTTLGGQVEKSLAAINAPDKRVADLEKKLATVDTSVDTITGTISKLQNEQKSAAGSQQKLIADLQQSVAGLNNKISTTLASTKTELDKTLSTTEEKVATLFSQHNELKSNIANQQKALSGLETSVASLDSKMSTNLASTKTELGKALSSTETKVAAVSSQQNELKSSIASQQKALSGLESSVAGLNSKITSVEGAQKVALASQAKDLQAQLASQFDSRIDAVSKQVTGISTLEQKLSPQIAATDKAVADIRQQLASLGKTVDMNAAANGDSGKTLGETRKALDSLEAKLAAMTAEMDAALARLHSQEAAIKEQQNIVNSNGSNPFAEQIARQIDDRLAPQAETLSSQANLIKSLEATLAAQVADIDGLRDSSARLNDEISATRTALEQAREQSEGQSGVGADQLNTLATAVKLEVSGLNRELEGAIAKISQQETQLAQWRTDFENRLTSYQMDRKPDGGEDFSQLQGQLASQLEDMQTLRTANTQLAEEVASTRQQLDELRKTISTPVARTSAGGAAEADLLAVQTRMDDLTRKLESSTTRLSSQEKTFNEWQLELESRLANHERALATAKPASSTTAPDESVNIEINNIKRTIAALKKQHPFVNFPKE